MGEVAVSSEEVEVTSCREDGEKGEIETEAIRFEEKETKRDGLLKWEKFLPKLSLRVLLVEADDSTRQIVAALLRKCSYRVAAVADGLKAWEILKGSSHNIDLILTEVDLPLISGYALLTLIMEHEICKNIPVIMMSSQDSVSTVYKCMLKGAADYLVKPLRRNELRNLWQHVWRRKSSLAGASSHRDESVGQQKLEATSENNSANNRSSGFEDCSKKSKEQIEKGTDAQSSCTKPEMEDASEGMKNTHNFLQRKQGNPLEIEVNGQKHDDLTSFCKLLSTCDGHTRVSACGNANMGTTNGEVTGETSNELANSPKEAFDFMRGTYRSYDSASKDGMSNVDSLPQLDLSLRRPHPESNAFEERTVLRQSNVSAFTRYVGRPIQMQCSISPVSTDQIKDMGTDGGKNSLEIAGYSPDAPGPPSLPSIQRSIASLAMGRSEDQQNKSEVDFSWQKQGSFPLPVPVKGIRVSTRNVGYGPVVSPMFVTQSGLSPTPSPNQISQPEFTSRLQQPFHVSSYEISKSEQLYDRHGYNKESKLDSTKEQARTPTAEQSSSLYNGALTQPNSIGYCSASGSNSNADAENKCDDGFAAVPTTLSSQRSLQREAALTKFRLKRKDRCFEKKVRYESRKKLAEQRPRVKGQFVRQKPDAPAPASAQENRNTS